MISGCCASEASIVGPSGSGESATVPVIQSFGLGSLPAGAPGTVQPSIGLPSASNDVVPWPPGPTMSSTQTPGSATTSSAAYVSEISICWPAYSDRSIRHCS